MAKPWMSDVAAAVRQRIEQEGVKNDKEAEEQFRALATTWVEAATKGHPDISEAELLKIGENDELLRQRSGEIWSALVKRTLIRFFQEELDQRALAGTLDYELASDEESVSSRRRTD